MSKPTLCVFMICRNEERDIGRAIASIAPIADKFVVVDTGSTDGTAIAAADAAFAANKNLDFHTYLEASERNENGDWQLWDFAKARNRAIELAELQGCTWLIWIDADDELEDPAPIRRAMMRLDKDCFSMFVSASGQKWLHLRMWQTDRKVRFAGAVHEVPTIDGLTNDVCYATFRHDATPGEFQENSNVRNLRILCREWEEKQTSRTAFYMACTHRDAGRHSEAAAWFQKRIDFGEGFREEYLFSMLYRARALRAAGDDEAELATLVQALKLAPDWAEFHVELAVAYHKRGEYALAVEAALKAVDMPIIPSALWREASAYRDGPCRIISWCFEELGDRAQAIAWADLAECRINERDVEWLTRSARLRSEFLAAALPAPAIAHLKRRTVALVRPGAIGDILMTLNLIPAFKEANPDTDVHYFCHASYGKPDALLPLMMAAGVDLVMDVAALPAWAKRYDQVINLVGYPLAEGYPDKPMRQHLLWYFAAEMGLHGTTEGDTTYGLPSLVLPRPGVVNRIDGGYATLQRVAGWSKYKEWADEKWDEVIRRLPFRVIEIGEKQGRTLAESIAVIANARMHLGIDSFGNHLTNYAWTDGPADTIEKMADARQVPGVVLWGSTQATGSGYPTNINISKGFACQPCFRENPAMSVSPRIPVACVSPPRATYEDDTPHGCMAAISVEEVVDAARKVWSTTGERI